MTAAILQMLPKPRGRQAVGMPPVLRLYPAFKQGRSFVYAIAFKGGVLKIGKTGAPRARLYDHWKRASGEVIWVHLFAPVLDQTARITEYGVPKALAPIARRINSSEWFYCDADRKEVVQLMRDLIATTDKKVRADLLVSKERDGRIKAAKALLAASGITGLSVY
jgi:hypothetical protein